MSENQDLVIARIDQASHLLAEAKDAQDAKKLADIARAAEIYAQRQKSSETIIKYAHAIKIKAERLMGEFLKTAPKATGGEHGGKHKLNGSREEPSNKTPT